MSKLFIIKTNGEYVVDFYISEITRKANHITTKTKRFATRFSSKEDALGVISKFKIEGGELEEWENLESLVVKK